ncbi:fungal-specific transcription factor domain-containing protein, partial [Mycena rosella]
MPEGIADPGAQQGKRRRLQGACDVCRVKKGESSDSAEMPGNRCTNCIMTGAQCTHARVKPVEKLPSPPPDPVVKTAQEHVANILSTSTLYIPPTDLLSVLVQVARYARSLEEQLAALRPQTLVPKLRSPQPSTEDLPSPEAPVDTGEQLTIKDPLSSLITNAKAGLFYGKSSSVQFIKSAIKRIHGNNSIVVGVQRPEFWTAQPWEVLSIETPQQVFPESDLVTSLTRIYFEQINSILGILHFPTFCQSVADGLHFRDQQFGAIVLAVCSLASRYSDDPRHSCGYKWFRQVRPLRASFSPEPSLQQLQLICLSVVYLAGTANAEECWILVGLGLRCAQGAGAHHRSGYSRMNPLEAELYKRVFYVLVSSDIIMSSFEGRPCITHSMDFDLDLPIDCDEEYWGVPNAVQPPGKPSTSAFVVTYLPLMAILGRIQREVYPLNGQSPSSETIAELDSELNKWVDAIPEHLRWDPNQENQIFLDQSAALYVATYHFTNPVLAEPSSQTAAQMLIHRPFIPAPGKESMSSTDFPSLAICANAARSCGHVMDVQTRRGRGLLPIPQVITVLFDCAVVLLINVWAVVGKSRTTERYNRATADVQNCVRVLRLYERRWKMRYYSAMLNIGKYTSDRPSLKRPRDTEEASDPSEGLTVSDFSATSPEVRPIAGASRACALSVAQQIQA